MSKIKCLMCGTVLESTYRHDWRSCGCLNQAFIDGGDAYLRYGAMDMTQVEIINEGRQLPVPDRASVVGDSSAEGSHTDVEVASGDGQTEQSSNTGGDSNISATGEDGTGK